MANPKDFGSSPNSSKENDDTDPGVPLDGATKIASAPAGVSSDTVALNRELDAERMRVHVSGDRYRNLGPVLIIVGILTGVSAWGLGRLSTRVAQKISEDSVERVPVVVAKKDVAEGTVLDADNLAQDFIPRDLVTASVVIPSQVEEIWGKKIASPLLRGDTIRWEQLKGSEKNRNLSPYIRPGARAYSMAVEAKNGFGGWLHYFDEVDVVVVMPSPKNPTDFISYTLTSGVPVLAAGIEAQSTSNITQYDSDEYEEVSLLLLPEEIEAIALAQKEGKVRLVLRPPKEPIEARKQDFATFDTLFTGQRTSTLVEPVKPKPKQILIMRPKRGRH